MSASLRPELSRAAPSPVIPTVAVILGAVVFTVDTLTPLDTAIAVLYVAVVLLLADRLSRAGILALGGLCVALTLLSLVLVHGETYEPEAIMRAIVSVVAILVATLLSLRGQKATESLRSQAALLDLTHDAILVRDAHDTILFWNRGAEELYGWTAREAVGRRTAELLQTVFPGPAGAVERNLGEEGRWEGELVHTRKDGSQVIVASRWSLQRDARGRPAATMETNNDITARRRSEGELRKAQEALDHVERVTTLGQMTATIAHEVNQPLAAVVANGEAGLRWLRRAEPDLREVEDAMVRMIANGRRAGEVVARLRALARRSAPEHVPVDLASVATEAAALLERELADHRVELTLALQPALPAVTGDRVQLQQVVINLMMNAVEAMQDSPLPRRLAVTTRCERTDERGPRVLLEVRDRGNGVAEADLPRLFEPFYTSKPNGMGLGLSICRSILEVHGGTIDAAPRPEGGMEFRLSLPPAKEPAA